MSDTQDKNERAKGQAKAQLESVQNMVARVKHCQGCSGDEDCELSDEEICAGINIYYEESITKVTEEDRENYHDEDRARNAITEDALSVEVRSRWHVPGSGDNSNVEYTILLCTGGPAARITGNLSEHGEPETAYLQYQDWFTPWIIYPTTTEEDDALLTYAQQFYFMEAKNETGRLSQ